MFGTSPFGATPFCSLPGSEFVYPDGLLAVGFIGSVSIVSNGTVTLTGVQASGFVGNAVASVDSDVYVIGLQMLGEIGHTLVWGDIPTNQTPNWVPIND